MAKPYAGTGGKPTFREFITPIGLLVHSYHDKPSLKSKDEAGRIPDIDPATGIQNAEFKMTLAWSKQRMNELQELINLAQQVKGEAWPESMQPGAFFALQPFFRDGDNPEHNTKGREYLKGRYYLNFKQKAVGKPINPNAPPSPQNTVYTGAPGLLGPHGPEDKIMPIDVYPGCTGRVSGIMFGTEYMGKNFISVRLNNFQKYQDGDRIGGGGRPTAESQFGSIAGPGMQPQQGGFPGQQGAPDPFGGLGGGFQGQQPSHGYQQPGYQPQGPQGGYQQNQYGQFAGGPTIL